MNITGTQQNRSLRSVFFSLVWLCGNFLYMPARMYLVSFEYTASFQYVCQQQQWWGQKPTIHVRLITLLFQRLVMIFKERSRCVCWLHLKQKSSQKVLYTEILCTPGGLNLGHVYLAIASAVMFSTVITVPRPRILRAHSLWLGAKEFQDTMQMSGDTARERSPLCQHWLW